MDSKKNISNLIFICFILWVLAIFYIYFTKTVWPVLHLLKVILGWFLIIICAFGIGNKAKELLGIRTSTFIEDLTVCTGLGLGIIQILMLIMGVLNMYHPIYAYLILVVLIGLSAKNLYAWITTLASKWQQHSRNRFSFIGAVFLIVLVAGLTVCFFSSISPPVSEHGISVSMSVAKRYVIHGGLYKIPYNYPSNFPPGMSMLYVLGLLIYGSYVARLITFLFLLLTAVAVYSMTRKFFHRKIALFAATILISTPVIFKLFLGDHSFLGSLFFSFMAFYSYICWLSSSERSYRTGTSWLILSGIFAAMSLSWGFYSLFTPLVLIIMVFYSILKLTKNKSPQEIAGKISFFIIPFVVSIIPMLIRSYINTGNPFFPFFMNVIGKNMDVNIGGVKSLWGYLFPLWYIPFEKSISLSNFYHMGLVHILFLPAIFMVKEVGKTIRVFMTYIGIYIIVYLLAGRKIVFLYSIIPAVSIITAYIIVNLYGQKKYFYQFIMTIFLLSLGINSYIIWPWIRIQDKIDISLGYIQKKDYLEKNIPGFRAVDFINTRTPADSKILLIGEKKSFYINRETVFRGEWSKVPFVELAKDVNNADRLLEKLRDLNITHILVNLTETEALRKYHSNYWNEYVTNLFEILTKKLLKLKYHKGEYYLYEL